MKFAKFAATAAMIALAVSACSARESREERDAGPVVDRKFDVGAFQRITVAGPYDVQVKSDGAPGVSVHGGEAMIDEMEVVVKDGELRIMPKKKNGFWNWSRGSKIEVAVTGANALQGATIAGSGDVRIDRVASPSFKGQVAGSGDLGIDAIEVTDVELGVAGSGNVHAAGKTQRLKAEIAGSGDLDLSALETTDAEISIAGSGNVAARATGAAQVNIVGSGDVTLTGGAKCSVNKHGSGSVNCS